MRIRMLPFVFLAIWSANAAVLQARADITPLADERSVSATATGFDHYRGSQTRGPFTYKPTVPFQNWDLGQYGVFTYVFYAPFPDYAPSYNDTWATQRSSISAVAQQQLPAKVFEFWGQASGEPYTVNYDTTFSGSVTSSSMYRIRFSLDSRYDYSTEYILNAEFDCVMPSTCSYPNNNIQAGYRLTGPSGEVFSIVRLGQWLYGVSRGAYTINGNRSGTLPPGEYVIEAWANQTGSTYKGTEGNRWTSANYSGSLSLAPTSATCTINQQIMNVTLPEVTLSQPFSVKPWQVKYDNLGADFTVTQVTGSGNCVAQSNASSFAVSARPFVTGNETFAVFGHTNAAATVRTYKPYEAAPSQSDYLINGPFDPAADYIQWHTDGFTTEIAGSPPQSLFTGPVTAWFNLTAAGLSPQSHTFEQVLRGAEPAIHQGLMNSVPLIETYTIFQDPGRVSLLLINQQSQATGVQSDGSVISTIPLSFYYPSGTNPAAVLLNAPAAAFRIVLTGIESGSFTLAVSTENMARREVKETRVDGSISAGSNLVFDASLDTGSQGRGLILTANPIATLTLEINYLAGLPLDRGIKNSLSVKLEHARDGLSTGYNPKNAANELEAFIHEAEAQSGGKLPLDIANRLIGWTTDIIAELSEY